MEDNTDIFSAASSRVSVGAVGPSDYYSDGLSVHGKLTVNDNYGTEVDVGQTLTAIAERLCVLQPNFEMMRRYPALKDAYDQYKMMEKLLAQNDDNKD